MESTGLIAHQNDERVSRDPDDEDEEVEGAERDADPRFADQVLEARQGGLVATGGGGGVGRNVHDFTCTCNKMGNSNKIIWEMCVFVRVLSIHRCE